MLVLSRKVDECIHIGPDIMIKIIDVQGGRVRIGIEAPRGVTVLRAELMPPRDMHAPVKDAVTAE